MKNPNWSPVIEFRWLETFCQKEAVGTAIDMDDASWHGPRDEPTGTRGFLVLVAVDEHMDGERRVDGWERVAGTPARLEAALRASRGTRANDASAHCVFQVGRLYDRGLYRTCGPTVGRRCFR
jgi:hypothetical protein